MAIICEHCGTSHKDDLQKCTSCGARLVVVEKKYENRKVTVKAARLADVKEIALKCGFEVVSVNVDRGLAELSLRRNVNTPYYSKIRTLTDEIFSDLEPPVPSKKFIAPMVLFIVFACVAFPFMISSIVLGSLAGHAEGIDAPFTMMLIMFLVPAFVSALNMVIMIVQHRVYKRGVKARRNHMSELFAKADLCDKIILGGDV